MSETEATRLGGAGRLLYVGPLLTMFDRFSIAPLLIPIAAEFGRPLSEVTILASLYFLLYGGVQIVYGVLSDRFGRVVVIRVALTGMAAAGLLSAVAPNLPLLIAARGLTAALAGAVMPGSLVYIGDSFPFRVRQQAVASLLAAVAIGTTLAAAGAGLLAHFASWRVVFLLPSLAAIALALAMRWLPEPSRAHGPGGVLAQFRLVAGRPWAGFLNLFALFEGAAVLGFFPFLAPALQSHGQSAAIAGLVTAGYGVSVLAWTQLMRRVGSRIRARVLIFAGGAMLIAAYLIAASQQTVPSISAAGILIGGAYAVMHSVFQNWSTEVVPEARGTSTSLFATGVFLGAGIGSAAVGGLVGGHDFGRVFLAAAIVSVPVVVVGGIARGRFPTSSRGVEGSEPGLSA